MSTNPTRGTGPTGTPPDANHAPEPLSRDRVLSAALEIVDAQGLDALTMRRLGQHLGRHAMSLYRYFPNRAALLDGLVDLVLQELPAAVPAEQQGWQAQLRASGHQFRQLALAHSNMAVLIITQPLSTPLALRPRGTLRLLEQLLTLLAHAGLSVDEAIRVTHAYTGCLYGHILTELQQLNVHPDEPDPLLRLGLHTLPRTQFPHLRGAATELATYNGATQLDHTLDVLFSGLTQQLTTSALATANLEDPSSGHR